MFCRLVHTGAASESTSREAGAFVGALMEQAACEMWTSLNACSLERERMSVTLATGRCQYISSCEAPSVTNCNNYHLSSMPRVCGPPLLFRCSTFQPPCKSLGFCPLNGQLSTGNTFASTSCKHIKQLIFLISDAKNKARVALAFRNQQSQQLNN